MIDKNAVAQSGICSALLSKLSYRTYGTFGHKYCALLPQARVAVFMALYTVYNRLSVGRIEALIHVSVSWRVHAT